MRELCYLPMLLVWGIAWTLGPWLARERVTVRRIAYWAILALQLRYLSWRIFETLPAPALSFEVGYSLLVVTLEIVLSFAGNRYLKATLGFSDRSREADHHGRWWRDEPPLVDIMVPTYNEAWPILEKTLVGCLRQTHPRVRIWVCDDGRRAWLREQVEALGVGYLCRTDNLHAKAGNLNAALEQILRIQPVPAFLAVLDADFIPMPRFVSRALSLMHDERVGLVQTPQCHLNPDPFQTAFGAWRGWPDTQRYIFDTLLPAADAQARAYCCGTSFLVRTDVIRRIGGFPIESITEDVLTSIKAARAGYRTVYLNEHLTSGLAPEGLHEFLVQRGRWCLGAIQIGWWQFDGQKGLPFWKRLDSFERFLRWGYSSFARVLFLAMPLIYWASGVVPFTGRAWQLVWYSFPLLLLQRVHMTWVSRGAQLPLIGQASSLLTSFAVIPALRKGLFERTNHRFVVTDKGRQQAGVVVHWGTLRWLLGYALLLVGLMTYRLATRPLAAYGGDFAYVSVLWSVINLMIVCIAAAPCIERPRRRDEYRYSADEGATLSLADGRALPVRVTDLSVSGLRCTCSHAVAVGADVTIALLDVGPVRARVVRRGRNGELGVVLNPSERERHALIAKIFCSDKYIHPPDYGSGSVATLAVLRRLFA